MKNVDRRNVMFLARFQLMLYMVSDEILQVQGYRTFLGVWS